MSTHKPRPTHRQIARRKAVMWQAAAGGVILAAVAGAAVPGVRAFFAPAAPKKSGVAFNPQIQQKDFSTNEMDRQTAAGVLGTVTQQVKPAPTPKPVPETDPTETVATPPTAPAAPAPSEWAYIGSIITPVSRHALIKVDGQQQIFGIGATQGNNKLVAIEKEYIDVDVGGQVKRIVMNDRAMLAPTDPPKHPVTFRTPPVLPQPGGPGGPTAAMSPPGLKGAVPGTLDQARAMKEAAARAAAPTIPPPAPSPDMAESMNRDMVTKLLNDTSAPEEQRMKVYSQIGITPGMPIETAIGRLKEMGLDFNTEAGKRAMEWVHANAKGGGQGGK